MKILVAGIGLIGGSICKALRKYTDHEVGGYDIDPDIIIKAYNDKAINYAVSDKSGFNEYEILIICINPLFIEAFLKDCVPYLSKGMVIADVCGVKGKLPEEMTAFCSQHGFRYVSSHPMAGKERPGYENSDADLFFNANFIITPVDETNPHAADMIEELAGEIGFRNFSRISPEEHDRIIAYTSQLAHIVSSAYVKSPAMEKEKGFTGGSFQDMTRIATMNEDMWTALFSLNRERLIEEIDIFSDNIGKYRNALLNNDTQKLRRLIYESRVLKEKDLSNTAFLTRFD